MRKNILTKILTMLLKKGRISIISRSTPAFIDSGVVEPLSTLVLKKDWISAVMRFKGVKLPELREIMSLENTFAVKNFVCYSNLHVNRTLVSMNR